MDGKKDRTGGLPLLTLDAFRLWDCVGEGESVQHVGDLQGVYAGDVCLDGDAVKKEGRTNELPCRRRYAVNQVSKSD